MKPHNMQFPPAYSPGSRHLLDSLQLGGAGPAQPQIFRAENFRGFSGRAARGGNRNLYNHSLQIQAPQLQTTSQIPLNL